MKTSLIQLTIEIWQEESGVFVAYIPQLDLSSCGNSIEEAKANIKEALELFLEEAAKLGTIEAILEEAGFSKTDHEWRAPEMVAFEKMKFAV